MKTDFEQREPEPRRRRKPKRLRGFEKVVLTVGYGTILYGIIRGLVYVAVLLAQ